MHSLFDKINDRLFDSELPDIPIFFSFEDDDPEYKVWSLDSDCLVWIPESNVQGLESKV